MKRVVVSLLLPLMLSSAPAPDAFSSCMHGLRASLSDLGSPAATHVSASLHEIRSLHAGLESSHREYLAESVDLEAERRALDRLLRAGTDELRQVVLLLNNLGPMYADFNERVRVHNVEADQQHAASAAAETEGAIARANEWSGRINARVALMQAQLAELDRQRDELFQRRDRILAGIQEGARRFEEAYRRSSELDQTATLYIRECSTLRRRVLALRQVRDAPARPPRTETIAESSYQVLSEVFPSLSTELFRNLAPVQPEVRRLFRSNIVLPFRRMRTLATRAGLTRSHIGTAVVAAEILTPATVQAMNAQERALVDHIFLIGDYGRALERIRASGGFASNSPEAIAIREELQRLAFEMPRDRRHFLLQSWRNPEFLNAVVVEAVANYSAERVGEMGARITNRLNNAERARLAGGGVRLFRELLRSTGDVAADTSVHLSALLLRHSLATARGQDSAARPPGETQQPRPAEVDAAPITTGRAASAQ